MRKKYIFLIYPLLIMGVLLILTISCKDDDDNSNGSIPVLTTTAITDIAMNTASSGGTITSDCGATVTARGVCWSIGQTPTILDNKTTDGTGAGTFVSNMSDLLANTTYYVRAYATNSNGTAYGSAMSFTTQINSFTDTRDGNVYQITTIGDQVWMAENLKYLPSVVGPKTSSETTPYYYVYDYYDGTDVNAAKATSNYATYGVLYNWASAVNACPTGWHLPSDEEWTQLTDYLGGTAGGKLKETGSTHWGSSNTATNETGFTALPGGDLDYNGDFYGIGYFGSWWSATESSIKHAWIRDMYSYDNNVNREYDGKRRGFSVRCVRD